MHSHTHTHVYKRIDVQIHTHMHIYTYIMSAQIHTYTYIHTRIQNVHMNARKARLKRRRGSDAREAQLDTKKLCPSPCPHHDSAPSRPHPLICTGAEPIHPVHCPRQLPTWPRPPKGGHFSAILAGRLCCLLPNTFCLIFAALGIKPFATLVILMKTPTFGGVG